jgi:hypothetical protein
MTAIARHPIAAGLGFLALAGAVLLGGFLVLVRSTEKPPAPGELSAQGVAHRMLVGRESIDTDVGEPDRYVFRVVYQSTDSNVGTSLFATHIGVVVCLRDHRATDAVRFSYLHFRPSCSGGRATVTPAETSLAADRKRWGGEFAAGADQRDEPTPRRIGSP